MALVQAAYGAGHFYKRGNWRASLQDAAGNDAKVPPSLWREAEVEYPVAGGRVVSSDPGVLRFGAGTLGQQGDIAVVWQCRRQQRVNDDFY